ncbi:hypothetical protein EAX61_05430 [Dokdonia sinensis]|uniref:Competence protein n=1 Tax=Dokdonia sinensis TaxID=2479847 RepID=A0A3M0G7N3_9FLAO|nr:hypothetical protein [Dokdonia sinensis]RMB60924.1 hypothetical protein EAX61_05430 [Dokdonia sinensis]
MKFALLDNKRIEAQPNLIAECPNCGNAVRSYCGEQIVHHWKHIKLSDCDDWYETETEWHRNWKNHFDKSYQEVIRFDKNTNEKHIADIYNGEKDVVLEFQHSPIEIQEIKAREIFYDRMIWIIDLIAIKDNLEFHKSKSAIEYELSKMRHNLPKDFKVKEDFEMNESQKQVGDFLNMLGLDSVNTNESHYISELQNKYNDLCEKKNYSLMTWKYLHKRWNDNLKPKFIDIGNNYIYQLIEKVKIGNAYIVKQYEKQRFINHYR